MAMANHKNLTAYKNIIKKIHIALKPKHAVFDLSRSQSGFTLIEMLVTIAIIAILTAITAPSFSRYLKRAHYVEIVNSTAAFKLGVTECFQVEGALSSCNGGNNGVPADLSSTSSKSLIKSISTTKGIITATPKNKEGFKATDTYILTPSDEHGSLVWQTSGGAIIAGYAR